MFCELGLRYVVHLCRFPLFVEYLCSISFSPFISRAAPFPPFISRIASFSPSIEQTHHILFPLYRTNTLHVVYVHTVTNAAIVNGLSGLPYLQHVVIAYARQRPLLLQFTTRRLPLHSGSTKCRSPSPCVPRERRSTPQAPPPSGPQEAPRRSTHHSALKTRRDSGPTGSRADPLPPMRESSRWTDSTAESRPRHCVP